MVVDRTMYISGQLGMDPASGQLVEGGVQAQTKQVACSINQAHHHIISVFPDVYSQFDSIFIFRRLL